MGEPNAEDGLVAEVTEQYKKNYDSWFDEAKRMTLAEANDDKLVILEQGYLKSISARNEEKNVKTLNRSKKSASTRILGRKVLKENRGRGPNNMMDVDVSTLSGSKRKDHSDSESTGPNKLHQKDTV